MSTVQTWQTTAADLDATLGLGSEMGSRLVGGEVLELVSDLGGGKTTFVKGLANGMGSHDAVRSPSFTLHNQYQGDGLTIHHFDFYRLFEPGDMRDELAEVLQDPHAVAVVEWGQLVTDVLPGEHFKIEINVTGDQTRQFNFSYPERLKYLLPHNT